MKRTKTAVLVMLIILLAATMLSDASTPAIIAANQIATNQSHVGANQTSNESLLTDPQNSGQPKEPKFEAIFAIAGLLAVAYLVLRQRK